MGASTNILTGYLISRVKVRTLVVASALVTMIASPLMATIDVHTSYWRAAFWALLLSPVNPDGTLALLIIPCTYDTKG
jgi:nitrate/nitrite transporter NarK